MANILVLCTANVCRSVYTTALLASTLAPSAVGVHGAGLKAIEGNAPCNLVTARLRAAGLPAPTRGAQLVDRTALQAADLILVMTAGQRIAVAKLLPEVRDRTMTLIETVVLAKELEQRTVRCESLSDYVLQLNLLRSRVAMPTLHERRLLLGFIPVRGRARPAISIVDGHTSGSAREHARTLDQIAAGVRQLETAWSLQPWAATVTDDEVSA